MLLKSHTKISHCLLLQETVKCKNAIASIVLEACLNSSCVNVSGTMCSSANDTTRIMATFTNLQENKNYLLSLHVLYNGGVVLRSQQVAISKCVVFLAESLAYICIQVHLMSGTFQLSQ